MRFFFPPDLLETFDLGAWTSEICTWAHSTAAMHTPAVDGVHHGDSTASAVRMDTTASAVQQRSALLALQPVAVASALPAPISKDDESDDESEDDESEEEARRAGAKRRRHACLDPDWGHSIKQRINISIKTMLSAAAAPSGESAPPKAKKQRQHKYAKRKSRRAGAPTWPESRGSVVLNMLAAMLSATPKVKALRGPGRRSGAWS